MSDALLRDLAVKCGVGISWVDLSGETREVSVASLRAVLTALGLSVENDAALRNALAIVEAGDMAEHGAALLTGRTGLPVALPFAIAGTGAIELELENGTIQSILPVVGADGRPTLPPIDEPGYHKLHLGARSVQLAIAPTRCITLRDLPEGPGRGEGRQADGWGIATQVYSLRSQGDGGIGGFAGVAAFGRSAGRLGADIVTISPVHALFGSEPLHFSPYSPSTRLFLNPLHADPAAVFGREAVADAATAEGLSDEMERLAALPLIDWDAATRARQTLYRHLFRQLVAPGTAFGAQQAEFQRILADASPLLKGHAIFEALHAAQRRDNADRWHWKDWPEAFRDPASAEVSAFAEREADEVSYQIFLQWMTGRSYAEAQRACREAGMRVGLVADLAIGMDGAGSHAWSRQREILPGLSIGAPPDYYNSEGQSWGLSAFSPRGLLSSGFQPFIETLRANLRHAGGLRIDHVMGMSRLWLVPEGARATEGAYLTYPSETLFRLIALESHRHRAVVIGEDLGTLPMGFREYLRDQGIAGMRVLRFEKTDAGHIPPRDWDPSAVAMTSTHDMAPTASWWRGADMDGNADASIAASDLDTREWDRGQLWGALQAEGIGSEARPAIDDATPIVDAAIRYVATSPCSMTIIALEDVLAIETRPNVPGTTTEKPNWRHRLDGEAGALLDPPEVLARLMPLGARSPGDA
jgi:4-alpha-glucanotransferase